jgi:hypothetical protein
MTKLPRSAFTAFLSGLSLLALPSLANATAFSVGTGPRPINTASLNAAGLGTRVLFPTGRTMPFGSVSLIAGSAADWNDGDRDERYTTRLASLSLSGGYRQDMADRKEGALVPYLLGGGVLTYSRTADGSVDDDLWKSAGKGIGLMGGGGLDTFITSHFSLGLELGAAAVFYRHTMKDKDGDPNDYAGVTVLSTTSAIQATVWR